MASLLNKTSELPITGINSNLTFSEEEVYAWYFLNIPEQEYGVYPEDAGLPKYLRQTLKKLSTENPNTTYNYHILVTSTEAYATPSVALGVKLGDRSETETTIIPKSFNKFINLLADAPLNDYITNEELNFWETKSNFYNNFFGTTLGLTPLTSNQLAYLVRKRFYPAMSIPNILPAATNKEVWGESIITEIANARITPYPKYLQITQDIGTELITGYRAGVEIIKLPEVSKYPEFESWLPYVKSFPFVTDFSIRFEWENETELTNLTTRITVEASTTEKLIENTTDLIGHYEESDIYPAWSSGDQIALLNETIPNGKNVDYNNRKKTSELPITDIIDNLTFSKTHVVTWVKIPLTQFEYLDDSSKERLAYNMDIALSNLLSSEEKNIECHLIVQGAPFDSKGWIQNLNEKTAPHKPLPYHKEFLTRMYNYVDNSDFRERSVLLGVYVGLRSTYGPNKTVSPTLTESVLNIIPSVVAETVTKQELNYWKTISDSIVYALQTSRISAIPAEAEEIAFAVRKNFFPSMLLPSPKELAVGISNVWTKNEIDYLADGNLKNYSKYLKITQLIDGAETEGYRATLCFSKFPETMYFPQGEPWIHYASLLPFPVDFNLRFTLEPARKVRKEVGRKLKEVIDQAINMESAGGDSSIEVQQQIETGEELDYTLKKDPTPWVYGRYRMSVEAPTLQELKDRVKQVINHYNAIDIHVKWPTADQLTLLKESIPNSKVTNAAYYQRHTLNGISTGIPTGAGTTGDQYSFTPQGDVRGWIGPYLGYTTGQTQEPVFLSMHSTIDTQHANGCTITGSPGSGKTLTALTLAYQTVLAGTWTIIIDPKADAKNLVKLPGMEHGKVLDFKNGNTGILDPFSFEGTLAFKTNLALETIYLFLGGTDKITEEQQVELSKAIERITHFPDPSLAKIVEFLFYSKAPAAQSLGAKLNIISKLPFSQLCFTSSETKQQLRAEDGLTILTLKGLDLPNTDTPAEEFTNSNRLAVGVMFLLSSFTRELMLGANEKHPKAIIIDEAWVVTSTLQGKKLIREVARMGRSHNTALTLISQNSSDFMGSDITNSVSTRLAFRVDGEDEVLKALTFLQLEHTDSNKDTISSLTSGECLMKDWSGRIARVQVDAWDEKVLEALETNPNRKASNNH